VSSEFEAIAPAVCEQAQAAPRNEPVTPSIAAGTRLTLGSDAPELDLPPGRWAVQIDVPTHSFVSVGLLGPHDAMRHFEVAARGELRRVNASTVHNDDRRLPAFVSFESRSAPEPIMLVADVTAAVRVVRIAASTTRSEPPVAVLGSAVTHPLLPPRAPALVGMPFPIEHKAGYALTVPHRYQFVRVDVAEALRSAFHQTRVRYGRNLIAVGDASQWNGDRPRMDVDDPRHISHVGGRDVDIGLAARDSSSALRPRCEGVLVEKDALQCVPGTVTDFDAERMAYFLGLLIDGPTPGGRHISDRRRRPGPLVDVETIFTDQAFIDAMREALQVLRRKQWIHEESYGLLQEDGLLRPSPWHTDHVHVRFVGGEGEVSPVLLATDGVGTELPSRPDGAAETGPKP